MPPIVIAHRTCPRDAPENSIEGIHRAAAFGADAVEIDVRLSRDGVPVLMHDPTLWRTTRRLRRVRSLTADRIARLTIGQSASTVPTLDDVLEELPSGLRLAMDIKDPRAGPATLAAVRRHAAEARVLWWSQHDAPLALAREQAPQLEAALLRDTKPGAQTVRMFDDAQRLGAGAVSAHWNVVNADVVAEAERRGLRVYSWCQSFDAHAEKRGVPLSGVVTDWPVEARRVLAGDSAD